MARPRTIVEVGSPGETVDAPIYNRAEARRVERRLRRAAKREGRAFWKFPPARSPSESD